ncbi:IucA/IucC family protein [Marinomonas sp. BSi20584]|uniref:IucA/IucC family protein n=1 Tax=Marinomonas sp. BSi20584 TaxID=1594462 RepID=UPI000C1E8CC7|nr:IucA/IucC family protein [Marinomonas sp. BSi20584]PJE53604.1 siderophore biosynthesis protein [Marinomonas sp. BSi20584]
MTSTQNSRWLNKLYEQYLNTYFRETGVEISKLEIPHTNNPLFDMLDPTEASICFAYPFTSSDTILYGSIIHLSLTGYHQYGEQFVLESAKGFHVERLTEIQPLLKLISQQLAFEAEPLDAQHEAAATLYEHMCNSVERSRFFMNERSGPIDSLHLVKDFITSEQGMLLGHPFHVTSKANIGFSEDDIRRYSPELGASFKLHYFAVAPELLQTYASGHDVSKLIDPKAQYEAEQLLGTKSNQYELLPCHPWQANFLLDNDEIRRKLDGQAIISLGPIGQVVWPTSSVRTVWMPETGLFLKLSLDVRITNFIRNNPTEQIIRAIDASRLLNKIGPDESQENLRLLPELAAQTLKIPELEASFGIVYRAGLEASALAKTRILGSLVEENLETGELPLLHYINQAAQVANTSVTKDFICDWWAQYIKVSLLPALELFAKTGISLEAHLQNSLMRFENGIPIQLVVRDMEGVSVVKDSVLGTRCPEVKHDSSVWYSTDEAWFRFKYYLVVNHLAHLIGAIARFCPTTEDDLWRITGQTLFDANKSEQGKSYVQQLLQTRELPAKANMLSTFQKSGEKPVWVGILNPLCRYHYCGLTPLNKTEMTVPYQQAEQRVIDQLFEALLFERALSYQQVNDSLHIPVTKELSYQCNARISFSFGRIRLQPGTLRRQESDQSNAPSLNQVMLDLAQVIEVEPEHWTQFQQELIQTLVKHAQALQSLPAIPLREMTYFEQEARANNGHLYHPSFKSRIGFDLIENERFGPELSSGYPVVWIAVDQSLIQTKTSESYNWETIYRQQFSSSEIKSFKTQIAEAGKTFHKVALLPVHPWQWEKVIRVFYQDQIVKAQMIKLNVKGPDYLPQQSIRTLSNVSNLWAPSVKLAMSLINTSTSRVLAPHTVQNAAPISDWLWQLVQDDVVLPEAHKPIILREIAGLSVSPSLQIPAQYGALACIWRESVYPYLKEDQSACPVTILMQLDLDKRPVIDPWINQHGIENWIQKLIERVYLPVMHLLWQYGTALESHAQNMLLIHQDGMPIKVALKDFHDGVRYSRELMGNSVTLPELTDAPTAHAAVNPNSFLETNSASELRDFTQDALCFVNLAELSWFIHLHYGFDEEKFWQLTRTVIEQYQSNNPNIADRFKLFDFFAAQIDVEQLASRRFLPEIRLRVMSVANPLSGAR